MLVVLGLWGGLIPFIGPYFGYAFGSHATWHWTANRLWLDVLPGASVVLGGLMLMWSGHRFSGSVASWFAMAGGAWFAVGPPVSRLWEHGPGPIGAPLFGHVRQTFELIGYFYGLGAVVMGLAAFALGRFVSRPALIPIEPPVEEPAGQAQARAYVVAPADQSAPGEAAADGEAVDSEAAPDDAETTEQRVPAGVS